MSIQDDKKEIAHLEEVNAELTRSLGRCRELLSECRGKLAANSNEPEASNADEPPALTTQEGSSNRRSKSR